MNKLINNLHGSLLIMRYHHLLTTSKSVHEACEFYYSTLGDQIDTLAETYIGAGGNLTMPKFLEIEILPITQCLDRLKMDIDDLQPNQVSEFQSQLDDIKNTINKTFYLITLE